jgi:hypothetical protein
MTTDAEKERTYSIKIEKIGAHYVGKVAEVNGISVNGMNVDFWAITTIGLYGSHIREINLDGGAQLRCTTDKLLGSITICVPGIQQEVQVDLSSIYELSYTSKA